ncbi:hypothetical protein [Pedobacter agri]|uniref:hypothetical protein n=1 Tax=Pedobacter agri TaxID=454586 RepID=UPI00292EB209|nr:hypothetical protein [Pedobacter agri]
MKLELILILSYLVFTGCRFEHTRCTKLTPSDTTLIIYNILNGNKFLEENTETDTIFFLRNKFFNKSFPTHTKHFVVKSLEDNSRARMFNLGPGFPNDGRQRFTVFKFSYKNDTVKTGINEHGTNLFYETELVQHQKHWTITKQNISPGGKLEKFDYEHEQWYKELIKRLKPSKSDF